MKYKIFTNIFIDEELYELSSDSDEESKIIERDSSIVNRVLLTTEPIQSLGSWEKHTKVIILYSCFYTNKPWLIWI